MLTAMQTTTQIDESVRQKTVELCEAIVQQPEFQSIRQRVDSFMADEKAQQQYQSLTEKGRSLHEKQHQGLPLDQKEVAAFESERDRLLANPVAKSFIDAQEEMHEMQEGVHKFIQKTFELGRLPVEEDLAEGSCGSGCGCHH
ncbi:MAG TPA: YlbF family regulator [Verrucomicrobiae bacterium]|nr:YlbF family regulator [Verrucomicrobiae bacterium]